MIVFVLVAFRGKRIDSQVSKLAVGQRDAKIVKRAFERVISFVTWRAVVVLQFQPRSPGEHFGVNTVDLSIGFKPIVKVNVHGSSIGHFNRPLVVDSLVDCVDGTANATRHVLRPFDAEVAGGVGLDHKCILDHFTKVF